jgi:hypothetical protein
MTAFPQHDGPGGRASLVIGGTGMLARATRWLASRYPPTLVVARRAGSFAQHAPGMVPIDLDWSRPDFASHIAAALGAAPPVAKALIWIHDPVRHLGPITALLPRADMVIVLGSMDGRPAIPDSAAGAVTVRLGSVAVPGGRRWLTDEEISGGAIAALEDGRSRIVGELRPLGE